jgi:hypothetical protein
LKLRIISSTNRELEIVSFEHYGRRDVFWRLCQPGAPWPRLTFQRGWISHLPEILKPAIANAMTDT